MVWHLHLLEDFDEDDVEARPSIDESTIDGDVIGGRRAQEGNCAHGFSGGRMILLVEADLAGRLLHQAVAGAGLHRRDLSRQLLEVMIRQRSLGSTQEASGEASQLLIASLVLFTMIIRWWRQWLRLGICTRHTIAAATLVPVIVAVIAPGSTLVVATATPTALGDTIFFMKLPGYQTIVGIVGVLFVEDAVATASTFIALGVVPAVLLMIRLRREDSSLLTLGVPGLRL
jgi:hypothetical protein